MNDKMLNVFKEYCSWSRNDFIIIVLSSLFLWILPKYYSIHWAILTFSWVIVLIKCFFFYTRNSSIPNVTAVGDSFSWRFFQNLPLTKKKLIILITALKLYESLPLLLFSLLSNSFFIQNDAFSFMRDLNFIKFIFNYLLFITLLSISSVANLINYPRIAYNKKNQKSLIPFIEVILLIAFMFLYFQFLSYYIYKIYSINVADYLLDLIKSLMGITLTWWFPLILFLFITYQYIRTLNTWSNEKSAYTKPINQKKRLRNIVVYVLLISIPFFVLDNRTPRFYLDSPLNKATYNKNYEEIDKLLKQNNNINQNNIYGFTPMLTAIHQGDLKTIKFLESRGASINGKLDKNTSGHKGYSAIFLAIDSNSKDVLEYVLSKNVNINEKSIEGFFPIHLASQRCRSDLIDLLIKKGADINLTNADGFIPAVVATRARCLSAVITLKDAGARFDILDKKGKSLGYHAKVQSEEFSYIVNKYSTNLK